MAEIPPVEENLSSGVTGVLQTLRETVETRIELFLVELKEQQIHQIEAAVLIAVALICGIMMVLLLTFAVVVIFWDNHRILVSLLLAGVYAAGAAGAIWKLRSLTKQWHPFSATLEEIKKDAACFKKQN
jgi:uncharacterized membrane protein YqjE